MRAREELIRLNGRQLIGVCMDSDHFTLTQAVTVSGAEQSTGAPYGLLRTARNEYPV